MHTHITFLKKNNIPCLQNMTCPWQSIAGYRKGKKMKR